VEQVVYVSYTSWASSSMKSFDFTVFAFAGRPRGRPEELLDLAAARFGGILDDKCRGSSSKVKQTEQGSESDWGRKVLRSYQFYKGSLYAHGTGQGGSAVVRLIRNHRPLQQHLTHWDPLVINQLEDRSTIKMTIDQQTIQDFCLPACTNITGGTLEAFLGKFDRRQLIRSN
jgi:hypothetical protein